MDNETIADIIAEMRNEGHTGPADALEWVREKMTYYADRLEAAHKREKAEHERKVQDALDCGGIVGAAHEREMSKIASKNGANFGQLGDCAKLREALFASQDFIDRVLMFLHGMETTFPGEDEIIDKIRSALAEPARNCDKYATADEALKAQEQMFNDSNFANGECKLGCPECDNPRVGCKIAWLFAPATEKEGGVK